MKICKHINWKIFIGKDFNDVKIWWCSNCGSLFHKIKLKNGKMSKRSRWNHPNIFL